MSPCRILRAVAVKFLMTVQGEVANEADGRRLRSRASRQRIVEAMVELVREGQMSPSAETVARRANVGARTVFRHFNDMESLLAEISSTIRSETAQMRTHSVVGDTPEEKLANHIDWRTRLFEKVMPFKKCEQTNRHRSQTLQRQHQTMVRQLREALNETFDGTLDRQTFEAMDLLLSFESWRRMREDQALSMDEARAIWHATALKLLR